jgi:hypothetical protein
MFHSQIFLSRVAVERQSDGGGVVARGNKWTKGHEQWLRESRERPLVREEKKRPSQLPAICEDSPCTPHSHPPTVSSLPNTELEAVRGEKSESQHAFLSILFFFLSLFF